MSKKTNKILIILARLVAIYCLFEHNIYGLVYACALLIELTIKGNRKND